MKELLNSKTKELTAELRKLGVKTYRKKSTGEVFVKRSEVKKVLAQLVSAAKKIEKTGKTGKTKKAPAKKAEKVEKAPAKKAKTAEKKA